MTETRFQEILDNTESLLASEVELDKWMEKFPYVSIFQTLKAKALKSRNDIEYDYQLKKAAISSPDRAKLYQFLIQPHVKEKIREIEELVHEEDETATKKPEKIPDSIDYPTLEEDNKEKRSNQQSQKEKEGLQTLEKQFLSEAISASIHQEAIDTPQESDLYNKNEEKLAPKIEEAFDDNTSLLDWLKAKSPSNRNENEQEKSTSNIIETFIHKDPQKISVEKENKPEMIPIDRPRKDFFSPENLARLSITEDEQFVTETLADIYSKQGHLKKAIMAYEKLSLKYPEKRDYFAALIKELKNKH